MMVCRRDNNGVQDQTESATLLLHSTQIVIMSLELTPSPSPNPSPGTIADPDASHT